MRFKAVIFDLDGTLVDSLADLADSMNTVLAGRGYAGHPLDAYRYFVGDGVEVLVQRALPQSHRDPATVSQCVAALRTEYSRRMTRKTRPYPGIDTMLQACRDAGLRLAVLSNKPHPATQQVVQKLLGDWPFVIVNGVKPDIPKKPDPTVALAMTQAMGLTPDQVLYMGDTATDMQTAAAAGFYAIGVLWGFRPAQELIDNGAQMLLAAPSGLIPWLGAP